MRQKGLLFAILVVTISLVLAGSVQALPPSTDPPLDHISLTLTAPQLQITEDGEGLDWLHLDGFSPSGAPGTPLLPGRLVDVALPPDVDPASVRVEVIEAETIGWPGSYEIAPSPPALSWEDEQEVVHWGRDSEHIVEDRNTEIYGQDAFYPASPVVLEGTSQMRKWRFVRLLFRPVQVNPASGELRLAGEVQVQISFQRDPDLDPERLRLELADSVMDDRAPERFHNYEQARAWYEIDSAPTAAQADTYVIITTDQIRNGAGAALADFVTHKEGQGWNVVIVTEGWYNGLTGPVACPAPCDQADRIRRWLVQNWPVYGIEYVLLIGDPDPVNPDHPAESAGDVPMKMVFPSRAVHAADVDKAQNPSDHYYADLTGDWDLNDNGIFGEYDGDRGPGGVDLEADVYVGRIPIYPAHHADWSARLTSILQKSINYETSGEMAWRDSMLLPMSFSVADLDAAYMAEAMMADYVTPRGYDTYTLYQQWKPGCDSALVSDEDMVDGAVPTRWAAQRYGLVTWHGHGSGDCAQVGYDSCFDGRLMCNADAVALDDGHPAFVYMGSCSNGTPEYPENLGTALLENGAIATVSASRVSLWKIVHGPSGEDWVPTKLFGSNLAIGYYTMDDVTAGKPMGDALYDTKASMANGMDDGTWHTLLTFNLYGDPSLGIDSGHPVPPAAPSNLTATSMPNSQIMLTWDDNSDNELQFLHFRATDGATFLPGTPTLLHDTTSQVVDDLTCGQAYQFKMRARNEFGETFSNVANATALNVDAYEPDDTFGTATSFQAGWAPQPRNFHEAGDEDWVAIHMTKSYAYYVQSTVPGNQENPTVVELYDTNGTDLLAQGTPCSLGSPESCILDWPAPSTGTYYVRVRNRTDLGGCTGHEYSLGIYRSSIPVDQPAAPSGLVATAVAYDQVILAWNDQSDNEDGFKVERWWWEGFGLPAWHTVGSTAAGETTYTDTGLRCNTTYPYRVRAYNAHGDSPGSLTAGDTTPAYDRNDNPLFGGDDDPAHAKPITTDGAAQIHSFHRENDADWSKFEATAGDVYEITAMDAGYNATPLLQLYDSDGATQLAWNAGCADGQHDACLRWVANKSETLYVRSLNLNGAGGCPGYEYALAVTRSAPDAGWPAAPMSLTATASAQSKIDLTWTDQSNDELGFEIERWGSSLPPWTVPVWQRIYIAGPGDQAYTDAGLNCDETYSYRLRAYNDSGASAYTGIAAAKTLFEDAYEEDDEELTAKAITVNGGSQERTFHDAGDDDWAGFAAQATKTYTITTSNLMGVDTVLKLYLAGFPDAIYVTENDDCVTGDPSSCIQSWSPLVDGQYLIWVSNKDGSGGCPGYRYDLTVVDDTLGDVLPLAPLDPIALGVSASEIEITWPSAAVHSGATEGHRLQRWYGTGWLDIARLDAAVQKYGDVGLPCGQGYEYRLLGYNTSGESASETFGAVTNACPLLPRMYDVYLPLVLRGQ